ncbi:MAG: J domain-containing protein [Acidobacteriota bacterium]
MSIADLAVVCKFGLAAGRYAAKRMDRAQACRTLGVRSGAAPSEIRRAYLRCAKRMHPDKQQNVDSAPFVLARRAYEVLTKPQSTEGGAVESPGSVHPALVHGVSVEGAAFGNGIYQFTIVGSRGIATELVPVREPRRRFVREFDLLRAPTRLRSKFPWTCIVLHGRIYPVMRTSSRFLALELLHLDRTSDVPYALRSNSRSWLLQRGPDDSLVARNEAGQLVRLAGYSAFSDASGALRTVGVRVFPPFEVPLRPWSPSPRAGL